jgi:CRP-like cAMP-binding protein
VSPEGAIGATWGLSRAVDGRTALHPEWYPVLARVPLFQGLSQRHLRRVGRLAELRRFKRGALVVRTGSPGEAFYVILEGHARVEPEVGRPHTLGEGDYFGELALLDGAPRAATVRAEDDLAAARISRSSFLELVRQEPPIGLALARGLVKLIRELEEQQA